MWGNNRSVDHWRGRLYKKNLENLPLRVREEKVNVDFMGDECWPFYEFSKIWTCVFRDLL